MANVLLAEDDTLLRMMIVKLLQVSGYQVHACSDGLQALELLGTGSFDLVITDLVMPGADGMEVLSQPFLRRSHQRGVESRGDCNWGGPHLLLLKKLEGFLHPGSSTGNDRLPG